MTASSWLNPSKFQARTDILISLVFWLGSLFRRLSALQTSAHSKDCNTIGSYHIDGGIVPVGCCCSYQSILSLAQWGMTDVKELERGVRSNCFLGEWFYFPWIPKSSRQYLRNLSTLFCGCKEGRRQVEMTKLIKIFLGYYIFSVVF